MSKKDIFFVVSVWVACLFAFLIGLYYLEVSDSASIAEHHDEKKEIKKAPTLKYGLVLDSLNIVRDTVHRNENFSTIFGKYNVPDMFLSELSLKTEEDKDFSKIEIGKKYTVYQTRDSIKLAKCIVYEGQLADIIIKFEDSLIILKEYKKIDTLHRSIGGIIKSSLYETLNQLKTSDQLPVEISKLFASQVDFFKLKEGDKFKIIYDEIHVNTKPYSVEKIYSAFFEQNNHRHYAINFSEDNKNEFFDENGNSLQQGTFLKAPLKFFQITSRFSKKRFHPVQKIFKAHLGTDYSAPYNTPILAVGDGKILEARYSQFNGNFVKIKHNSTYATQYLHMSRITKGLKPGKQVSKGQIIGYVGSTGLATGPHVCFRFWRNGKQVDGSKTKTMVTGDPIKKASREKFNLCKDQMLTALEKIVYNDPNSIVPGSMAGNKLLR